MNKMSTEKHYPDKQNRITLRCEHCGHAKAVDISRYLNASGPLKISFTWKCPNCHCDHSDCEGCMEKFCPRKRQTAVEIERRKIPRKQVNLICSVISRDKKKHPARIQNLSQKGLHIHIKTDHRLHEGATSSVEFFLDDAKKTLIQKDIVVKQLHRDSIKAEFTDTEDFSGSNRALGFYLLK